MLGYFHSWPNSFTLARACITRFDRAAHGLIGLLIMYERFIMFAQKSFMVCLLSILIALGISIPTSARSETLSTLDAAHLQSEYQNDMSRILSTRDSASLPDMKTLADGLQIKWRKVGGDYYYYIMDAICKGFGSINLHTREQYVLAEKYALIALQKSDACPIDPLITLSLSLHQVNSDKPQNPSSTKRWLLLRQSTTKHWLYTLYRLEKETDPNFNFNDLPAANIAPPSDTVLSSGTDPKGIKDKTTRTAYEAAIEKNKQKTLKYNQQYKLRRLSETYCPFIEKDIVMAYSTAPYNLPELRQLLDYYKLNEKEKAKILSGVSTIPNSPER